MSLSFREFKLLAKSNSKLLGHQSYHYFLFHAHRFYVTYQHCISILSSGNSVLSVGAGSAFTELALQKTIDIQLELVDFPEAIQLNKSHYANHKIVVHPANIVEQQLSGVSSLKDKHFDLVLYLEILEHIPKPPSLQLVELKKILRPGGKIVISTPNLGSLSRIINLLRMQPIIPKAEKTFAPVSFENEGVHRREYMPCEIRKAFTDNQLQLEQLEYSWYHLKPWSSAGLILPFEWLVPRFRPTVIYIGGC